MSFENFLDGVAKKAAENNAVQEGDYYGDDGLLYCGKCNTRRQCIIDDWRFKGRKKTVFCECKCRTEKHEAERIQRLHIEKMQHIERLRRLGFPDTDMQKWTFDKDDRANEKISDVAKHYVDKFTEMKMRGKGLLLFGKVGTGKTFISACIANALIDKGHACLVTNFARLVNTIQGKFEGKQDYIDSLNEFDLLVIDDLASERDTEYMGEIVQNIIDSRYRAGLPLIITTNLTSDELKHPNEIRKQRIYSRLFEMCFPVEVIGNDRRKQKLKEEYGTLGNMLGLNVAESDEK